LFQFTRNILSGWDNIDSLGGLNILRVAACIKTIYNVFLFLCLTFLGTKSKTLDIIFKSFYYFQHERSKIYHTTNEK